MVSRTNRIVFICLLIVAWAIFVGLSIEACGLIVNFVFSLYKPEFIPNLYQKLDLTFLYNSDRFSFFFIYGFMISISVLKALMFYFVTTLMHKMDLSKPFNTFVAKKISLISLFTTSIGLLSLFATQYNESITSTVFASNTIQSFLNEGQAFILMGGVLYIIATIFKSGVELQHENDLTV